MSFAIWAKTFYFPDIANFMQEETLFWLKNFLFSRHRKFYAGRDAFL